MKKLLLTAAALITVVSSASAAPTVHKEVLGAWCFMSEGDNEGEAFYTRRSPGDNCSDGILVIEPDRYEEVESGCRFTMVKTWFDRTIPVATKTPPGVPVSKINSSCEGEGDKWKEEATVYFSKGVLVFKRKEVKRVP
jgi:hypothetical protein